MFNPSSIRMTGPLARHKQGLWADLLAQGYTPLSSRNLLYLTAHLSRWLDDGGLQPVDLSEDRIEEFLDHRREIGYTHHLTQQGLNPILELLRGAGVLAPPQPPEVDLTPPEDLLRRYERYLTEERALVPATVQAYREEARQFLTGRFGGCALEFDRITPADLTAYILAQSRRWSIGTAKRKVTALRSLLGWLYLKGMLPVDLAGAVPAVAGYRLSGLPKGLADGEVEQLLQGCDRTTAVGRRAFAVLVLMTRLGLRSCEVARLELDDIHWSRGEMTVHGKGGKQDFLPLPRDVGEAMADYLRHARPATTCRKIFMTVRAPYRGLTPLGVREVAKQAGKRAGLAHVPTHRLRHSVATRMLRGGASLAQIAQVLGHRSLETTAIYAKVDLGALRPLCRPWPGGVS